MQAALINPYKVLEIAADAGAEEVRAAHRRLVRQYHPDVNRAPGAELRFQQVQEAYEILSDPAQRARVDAELATTAAARPPTTTAGHSDAREWAATGDGAGRNGGARTSGPWSPPGPIRGADRHVTLRLWRMPPPYSVQAVEFERFDPCPACAGGSLGYTAPMCTQCAGAGRVRRVHRSNVRIPPPRPGADAEMVLRGQGDVGEWSGPRGDVRVRILLDPSLRPKAADPDADGRDDGHGSAARPGRPAPPTLAARATVVVGTGAVVLLSVVFGLLHLGLVPLLAIGVIGALLVVAAVIYAFPDLIPHETPEDAARAAARVPGRTRGLRGDNG